MILRLLPVRLGATALVLFMALVTSVALAQATPAVPAQPIIPASIDVLPGARIFVMEQDGTRIVGADQGPLDGDPVMLVPGFSSDFPYLSPLINALAKRGCRVFSFNPPGQGGRLLASTAKPEDLGMTGMIKTVLNMHRYIRAQTGGKQVVWAGHSLGGMQVRMASLYVPANEIRAIVPLFSPSIKYSKANLLDPVMVYERLLDEQIFSNDLINDWTLGVYDWWRIQTATVEFVTEQNGLLKGLLGAPHPNEKSLAANVPYFIDWKATEQIIADIENATFTGPDATNLIDAWVHHDLTGVNILSFSGDDDGVISPADIVKEAKEMNYPNVHMKVGHIGAFYDKKYNPQIADLVSNLAHGQTVSQTLGQPLSQTLEIH